MRYKKETDVVYFPLLASVPVYITPVVSKAATRIGTKVTTLFVDGGEDDATPIDVVVVNGRRFLPEPPNP